MESLNHLMQVIDEGECIDVPVENTASPNISRNIPHPKIVEHHVNEILQSPRVKYEFLLTMQQR